jgi:hypothetical protein
MQQNRFVVGCRHGIGAHLTPTWHMPTPLADLAHADAG